MAERFDVFTTKKWKMDSNENLIIDATPTKAGVFFYLDRAGKKVGELRHPDDVFSRETLDSLNNVPYTTQDNHVSLFTPKTTTGKAFGVTLNDARQDGDMTACKIKVWDEKEQNSILGGGSLELSNGYRCDVIDESGTFNGVAFDKRQKNIRYNHVARVQKARGGESCRFRLDSADSAISGVEAERLDSGETQEQSIGDNMAEKTKVFQKELPLRKSGDFRLDAQEFEVDEAHKPKFDQVNVREGKLFAEIERLNTEATKTSVKMDSLEKEKETLVNNSEGTIPKEKFDAAVKTGIQLNSMAEQFKIEGYQKMDQSDLGKAVVKASGMFNDAKLDSAEYVQFAIEHLQEDHTKKVLKSRENLNKGNVFKIDNSDDELTGKSALESA